MRIDFNLCCSHHGLSHNWNGWSLSGTWKPMSAKKGAIKFIPRAHQKMSKSINCRKTSNRAFSQDFVIDAFPKHNDEMWSWWQKNIGCQQGRGEVAWFSLNKLINKEFFYSYCRMWSLTLCFPFWLLPGRRRGWLFFQQYVRFNSFNCARDTCMSKKAALKGIRLLWNV